MKNYNKFIWLILLILIVSCETTELELLDDPNVPTPASLDPSFTLNQIQVDFSEFFEEITEPTAEAVRLEYHFETYEVNYVSSNANLQNAWNFAYARILQDVKTLLVTAEENGLTEHAGMARTIKAYVLLTLVDCFGDVPYTEALQGDEGILFPIADSGSSVYDVALAELDAALVNFNTDASGSPSNDLFYGGDIDSWITLVNTLKLKYYLNKGMGSAFNGVVTGGDIITSSSDDFVWQSSNANDISRHQYYIEEYVAASTGEYMTNYTMWAMGVEKGIEDPRIRYYFYRQVDEFPTDAITLNNVLECWNDPRPTTYDPVDPNLPFCALFSRADGYWGRDHGNSEGIPPDNTTRTTFGTYPFGGRFDDGEAEPIDAGEGLDGAGIWPIMTNSFVYFMRAEAALTLGTSDNARDMLEQGVRASISKVMNFLPNPGEFDNVPTDDDVEDYVDFVLALYDGAASADEKMAVIGKEYFLALQGNGIEGYNLYRRTGTPVNLQPTMLGTGTFPRSFFYPNNSVDANPNISQKASFAEQVFWDTNPAGFIQ